MKKVCFTLIAFIVIIIGIFLLFPHDRLANIFFKLKRIQSVQISNLIIKPRNDFIIISNANPVIIALEGKDVIIDITKLNTPTSINIYKSNFNLLKIDNRISNYKVGNKTFDAIETDNDSNKEIKIIIDPKLILTIKINNYKSHKNDLNDILNYLNSNVTWIN